MQKKFTHIENLPVIPKLTQINTESGRFYRLPDGSMIPSVTTVLGYYEQAGLQKWKNKVGIEEAAAIGRRAAVRGSKFHDSMEKYLKNVPRKEILNELMPNVKQNVLDMFGVLDRIDNIQYLETAFYSTKLAIAGTADVIAEFDNELSVIDFKTSTKAKQEKYIQHYFEQATAYSIMYEEHVGVPINKIVIIICSDGEPQPQVFVKNKIDYIGSLTQKRVAYDFASVV